MFACALCRCCRCARASTCARCCATRAARPTRTRRAAIASCSTWRAISVCVPAFRASCVMNECGESALRRPTASTADECLHATRQVNLSPWGRSFVCLGRYFPCVFFGKRIGNYLVALYFFTKLLFALNLVGQLTLITTLTGVRRSPVCEARASLTHSPFTQ